MNIDATNYYTKKSNELYMSNSTFGAWLECPRREAAIAQGKWTPEENTAQLVGKYVDCALLEPQEFGTFCRQYTGKIEKQRGGKRSEFELADAMIERCKADELFMGAIEGTHQQIATWEMFGIKWKARFDNVDPERGVLTDLKTCKDFEAIWDNERRMRLPFYEAWSYWRQLAIYREGYKALYGDYPKLVTIAAVTKQARPRLKVLVFDGKAGNNGLCRFERELEKVREELPGIVTNRKKAFGGWEIKGFTACGKCDYCAETLEATIEQAESLVW